MKVAIVAVLLVWSVVAPAGAATVSVDNGRLDYVAAPGEANNMTIQGGPYTLPGGEFRVSEFYDVPLTGGAGCAETQFDGVYACSGFQTIRVVLGDGDDYTYFPVVEGSGRLPHPAEVDGGPGDDYLTSTDGGSTLTGGSGADIVLGGSGADTIQIRDGEKDREIRCYGGTDTVIADPVDTVDESCENIDIGVPASPPGPVGISVNDGATFTNDPDVTLNVRWPRLAYSLLVANDGGFAAAANLTVAATIPWTLSTSGPERLPKTVYARFVGGDAGPETYQDDIIVDQTAPAVTASITGRAAKGRKLKLRLTALDGVSGTPSMQVAPRRGATAATRPFRKRLTFRTRTRKAFVRVLDGAGNWSAWKRARR